jgi:hypothetical protein
MKLMITYKGLRWKCLLLYELINHKKVINSHGFTLVSAHEENVNIQHEIFINRNRHEDD